jgi:ATP-dependent Lon protease
MSNIAIENDHRNSGFTDLPINSMVDLSIVMFVCLPEGTVFFRIFDEF